MLYKNLGADVSNYESVVIYNTLYYSYFFQLVKNKLNNYNIHF